MLKFLGKAFLIIALIAATVYGWIYFTIKADLEHEEDEIVEEVNQVVEEVVTDETPSKVEVVENEEISKKINVLPTLVDKLTTNSAWCGTMQLVWNDFMDVAGGAPVFLEENIFAENLNKKTFSTEDLSDEYYYKKFGKKTLALKKEIENGIKDKFNETSDVLDLLDWSEDALDPNVEGVDRFIFYAMLKRDFEYPQEFTVLDNGKFKDNDNIKYFGINSETNKSVDKQLDVLYYENEDDFAIEIATKDKDKILLVRKDAFETNFNDIYKSVKSKANSYEGSKTFEAIDEFKMPNLEIDVLRNYDELSGEKFTAPKADGIINAAMQTIKLNIDEKGGSIKSEAVMDVTFTSSIMLPEDKPEPRYFYCDDEFVMFLVEEGKENPYFAVKVDDITLFQK